MIEIAFDVIPRPETISTHATSRPLENSADPQATLLSFVSEFRSELLLFFVQLGLSTGRSRLY